jgi:hypothetical protein
VILPVGIPPCLKTQHPTYRHMPMKPIEEISERTKALIGDFLLIDSQTALTFLDRAEDDSSREEDGVRSFRAATTAYRTIVKFLPHATLTREQYGSLMKTLAYLRERLDRHLETHKKVA